MNNLPPIDFKEDVEKYEAKAFKQNIDFTKCKHKDTELDPMRTHLKCKCGAAWTGSRLGELKLLLDNA